MAQVLCAQWQRRSGGGGYSWQRSSFSGPIECSLPRSIGRDGAGGHSPWISRYLEGLGGEVIVSNPRKVRAIYQHERKSDQRDALMLARIGRMDHALLYPIHHGSEEAQQDLLRFKLRDSLVRARVALINSVCFSLKSLGYAVCNPSSERFHKVAMERLPERVQHGCPKRASAGRAEHAHCRARA